MGRRAPLGVCASLAAVSAFSNRGYARGKLKARLAWGRSEVDAVEDLPLADAAALHGDEGDASRRSIVQFTAGMVYVEERADGKDGKVEIVVMRIGRLDTECSVTYCTKQETNDAAVGHRFLKVSSLLS